ncbi:hypothetical protein [Lentibacillus cibarius]|uniref:Uncharacterized protein n=1 Tax=Lentibacillus cibarius TaxID=2583219 RepID=A0A5S3QMZ5_9BACI|nr:hypothetical protein [Lentibacillus cibarius]TMN21856.1 hypothetical protein FFL34_06810 [Lentibacillus cibarius]
MKQEYRNYAKKLEEIGDKIISITNRTARLNEGLVHTKKELIENQNNARVATENYRLLINELLEMKVPSVVAGEHNGLISGISCFVHGHSLMRDSINIDENTVDKKQMAQGLAINDIGLGTVKRSSERISDILTNHYK